VDGVQICLTPIFGKIAGKQEPDVYLFAQTINKPGSVRIRISYPEGIGNGNRQATIDDIEWTGYNGPSDPVGVYGDGVFTSPVTGIIWEYAHATDEGNYPVNGKGIILRRANEPTSLQAVFPNGVGTFSFKYRKAYASTTHFDRQLAVYVDGVQTFLTPLFGTIAGQQERDIYTFSETINQAGSVGIRISYPEGIGNGNRQVTIDEVEWTEYSAVVDGNRNPLKNDVIIHVSDGKIVVNNAATGERIEVYNTLGQRVYQGLIRGETLIPSKPGIVVVKVGNRVQKVVVK
jgi:hypothetical protein